jgi:CRP-like cAMP-binding protein
MSSNPATQRIAELLEGANLFRDLAPDDLAAFAESFRERQFEKGEMVFARGDPGTHL